MTTLTMPENLDAVDDLIPTEADEEAILLKVHDAVAAEDQAAFDAEVTASDELPGQEIESTASEAAEEPDNIQLAEEAAAADPNYADNLIATVESLGDLRGERRLSASDDFLIQIQNAETECRRTEAVVNACKEDLKSAKADYESAVNKLRKLASGVDEMMRNDAERPLLAVAESTAEAATEPASVESPSPPADAMPAYVEFDASINWPAGQVPSQIEIVKTSYDLQAGTIHDCCLDDPEGVNVEDILLQQGDFRVASWREQTDQDVIPDYVLAFRAEQSLAAESAPPTDSDAADEASWRAFRIEDLDDLSDGTVGALHNADIETVGQLADYTAGKNAALGYQNQLTDIPKIGKAKAEQIENAMEKFWKERPDRKAVAGQ